MGKRKMRARRVLLVIRATSTLPFFFFRIVGMGEEETSSS